MGKFLRRTSTRLILTVVFSFTALAAWAVSSPVGSSPDDDFHLSSIWCGQGERPGLCEDITAISVNVPENVVRAPCFAFNPDATASCQDALSSTLMEVKHVNTVENAYPGGFYWAFSFFASEQVELSVLLIRLANAALFVGFAAVTFFLVRVELRYPMILSLAVTIVPLGMFVVGSTNPSSWVLFAPTFIFLLARTLVSSRQVPRSLAIIFVALALTIFSTGARSDAAAFAIFAVLLAAAAEGKASYRRKPFVATSLLILAISAWSFVSSRQSSMVVSGMSTESASAQQGSLFLLFRNILDLPGLLSGPLGTWKLGWLDTQLLSSVWVFMLIALGSLIVTATAAKKDWRELAIPGIAIAALLVVPLVLLQNSGAAVGAYVQPRYILPLLTLAIAALLTTKTRRLTINGRQDAIILVLVGSANFLALGSNVVRYLDSSSVWSGGTPLGVIVLLSVCFVASVALVLLGVTYRRFQTVAPANVV